MSFLHESLSESVQYIKGIGPKKAGLFKNLGINTAKELLFYSPYRYEDRKNFSAIKDLQIGCLSTVKGIVKAVRFKPRFVSGSNSILTLIIEDDGNLLKCIWFNQPYLKNYFKPVQELIIYGKVGEFNDSLEMANPEFEKVDDEKDDSVNIGRIVPVYSLTKGITNRFLRKIIKSALDNLLPKIQDSLSYGIRKKYNFLNLAKALLNLHFPETFETLEESRRRLSFEEFFLFQIVLLSRKLKKKTKVGISHKVNDDLITAFINSLPFKLTASQVRCLDEIRSDLSRINPMYRLLQGDVGSGKTIVALISSLIAVNSGSQVAIMVPTEILAQQHNDKINSQLSAFSFQNKKIKTKLLTGSLKDSEKDDCLKGIEEGKIDIVIGTHALLEENVRFKNLGLVVIDEQHKFGVAQRSLLAKKGVNPDVLIMTATPIPRTLALTIYGDLDISTINELPAERKPIQTKYYPPDKRNEAYDFIKEILRSGRQGYIVYPVIEESFDSDLLAAKQMFEFLSKEVFNGFKLGLIHGKLKQSSQKSIMDKFKKGKIDLLVTTTVLEVGIDVSNADVMLIEESGRFGLSTLHQLRGRVGRGSQEAYCLLTGELNSETAKERIDALLKSNDGFYIAEVDLSIRGQGDIFGSDQHGLMQFKLSDPLKQIELLKTARREAIEVLKIDPNLKSNENLIIKKALSEKYSLCVLSQVD